MRTLDHNRPAARGGARGGLWGPALLALLALLLWPPWTALGINPGNPAKAPASAGVKVLEPIHIVQTSQFDFGKIIAPSSGDETFPMASDGTVGEGMGDGQHVSGGSRGEYEVRYTPGESLNNGVSFSNKTCDAGIALSLISFRLSSNSAAGVDTWVAHGDLTVDANIASQVYECSFTISAEYS